MPARPTVAFSDYVAGLDPRGDTIGHRLLREFDLAPDLRSAHLVAHWYYTNRHVASPHTRLGISAEPVIPTDSPPDFTIDWRYRSSTSHLRLPFWAMLLLDVTDVTVTEGADPSTRRFCNFVYTNPRCEARNQFFHLLHERRAVDALGQLFRNASHPDLAARGFDNKRSVLRDYRFTIAFENSALPGYTTEKITDAWMADTVPIYWGNPRVLEEFPAGSFISFDEAGSLERLVERVLEVDADPSLYEQYRQANPIRSGHLSELLESYSVALDQFVVDIRDELAAQPPIRRRSRVTGARLRGRAAISRVARQVKRAVGSRAGGRLARRRP